MSSAPDAALPARRIFVTSALVLFTAGLSVALRGAVLGAVEADVLTALDAARASELAGALGGTAFWSFAFALLLASTFLERIGMGRGVVLAGAFFALGTLVAVAAPALGEGWSTYRALRVGFGLCGLGWGFMEATVNPLTTALYPHDKVSRLNVLHAWWPAGIVVGGASAPALAALGVGWQGQLALVVPPALVACALCAGVRFPATERAAAGVRWGEMFGELRRHPLFAVWLACMFLTAAAELAPGQWIDLTLTRTVGMRGIWLLVYVSGMMFVLRHFAGPIAHRIAPIGMLWASVAVATVGLLLLPLATSPLEGLAAATVWGLGVCFLWPTMLANVAERYPRGGELFIGMMGFAGALSIAFVLPMLGRVFDDARHALAGGEAAFAALAAGERADVLRRAAQTSFRTLAAFPAVLVAVFGAIWAWDRAHPRGGATGRRAASAVAIAALVAIASAVVAGCGADDAERRAPSAGARGRVLVVGLDGATEKVIAPLVAAGELPHLAGIARDGAHGPIRAGLPVLSPRIWTTVATGVEPEVHGILDWVRRAPDGELRLYSNLDRKVPAVWNIASAAGLRVGVVNWLITQPPDVVNGVMVS
ncbi:MAG: MFS transporter, partial [Myxococcales bacterium]|nr:MFS transporter [Myxococcales bacterium]